MKLFLKFIFIVLLFLIRVGDFVLLLPNLPLKNIKKILSLFSLSLKRIKQKNEKTKKSKVKSKLIFQRLSRSEILLRRTKIFNIKTAFTQPIINFLSGLSKLTQLKIALSNVFYILVKKTFRILTLFVQKIINLIFFVVKKIFFLIKLFFSFIKLLFLPFIYLTKIKNIPQLIFRKHKKIKHAHPFPFLVKVKYFILGISASFIFVFLPLLFLIFLQDIPSPRELTFRQTPETSKIYDRNGKLLYQIYAQQNRTIVPLNDIPKDLINATIAIEDKDFYNHPGFDVSAIIRSAIKDISGEDFQGGSTITQQLIKSALLTPETSMIRKIKEVIIAFWAERIYTKNQILEMYFNQVPYGGTAWGIEAASEVYFGKPAKELDLAQSAFLAGIPKAPTIYSPYGTNPNLWKVRQKEVLDRMVNLAYISKGQKEEAENKELTFRSTQIPIYAPHFVMYVKDYLIKKYGLPTVEKGGLKIITSLDLSLQETAQKIVTDEVNNNRQLNLTNGAALITNPANGDILAMVGSKDFSDPKDGNVNLTTSLRQPGSSIKVVTYSAALSRNFTAATILDDSPISFSSPGSPVYSPVNYDGRFHGKVPLRIALGNSFNIPAVKVLNQIGVSEMVDLGKKMGIKSWTEPSRYGLSITLGAAETTMTDMSTVYGVLANGGVRVDINPIIKITDYKGTVLEEKSYNNRSLAFAEQNKSEKSSVLNTGQRVLDEGVAFIISSILSDNNARSLEFGTNSPLSIKGKTVSVKTGTSDNKRDNWTIGYTASNAAAAPSFLVATWVGNNDNSPMSQNLASGITGAAPIWNKIMTTLLANTPDIKPSLPMDIVQKQCFGRTEYFIKGTENSVSCRLIPSPSPTTTK